jgi:hypothetical protein
VERDGGELWTGTRPESTKKILREGSEVLLSYLDRTEQCKGRASDRRECQRSGRGGIEGERWIWAQSRMDWM